DKSKIKNEDGGVGEETELWPTFDDFWDEYDKKVGNKDKIRPKWERLPHRDKEAIMAYIPGYKQAQPNKKYRKNPETFLNNESWNDELIQSEKNGFVANEEYFQKVYNSPIAKDENLFR